MTRQKRKRCSNDVTGELLSFLKESSQRTMDFLEMEAKREEKRIEYERENEARKDKLLELLLQKFI
jgi:hypothetical protein